MSQQEQRRPGLTDEDRAKLAEWAEQLQNGEGTPAKPGGGGGPGRPNQKVALECEACGDVFEVIPSRSDTARFCSSSCAHEMGFGGRPAAEGEVDG